MKKLILPLTLLAIVLACGKDNSSPGNGDTTILTATEEAMTEGNYKAILRPINFHVNGFFAYGNAEFILKEDNLRVITYLDDDAPVSHMQSVHIGGRCPTMADDANHDGAVDIKEAYAVVGPVIIPLDEDLSSKEAGADIYPKGSSFTYDRSVALSVLKTDLGNTSLVGKVVLVHGTADRDSVPATVATAPGMPRNLTIPMVCGVIKRIEDVVVTH